ncbi:hypothetical protein PoB_006968900 [Plakobranchus ocellatus]|uniref:Uncharacterized protein n=1 Tax=Plakobranchus ocellatus TaxID=259542 RepID=A0AAV4DGN6_9GAST|nr:hypothetical protein PoB_006968900 [Plakobranchus ocellatus]
MVSDDLSHSVSHLFVGYRRCPVAFESMSFPLPLFSSPGSVVRVHVSQAYRNIEITNVRTSLIFEPSAMLLSFQIVFNFVSAAVVCAILDNVSGFDPSPATIAPRYLNLLTVSRFLSTYFDISADAIGVVALHLGHHCTDFHAICSCRLVQKIHQAC